MPTASKSPDQSWSQWYRAVRPETGPVALDLSWIDPTTPRLTVDGVTKSMHLLPTFRQLEQLTARHISRRQLEKIAEIAGLRDLKIQGYLDADPSPITQLGGLEVLSFEGAPRVERLTAFASLPCRRFLQIGDLKRVEDFSPLGDLKHLEGLSLSDPITGGAQTVRSLAFLRDMPALTDLTIYGLELREGRLEDIADLTRLRFLGLQNVYDFDTVAFLAAKLPETRCELFAPWTEFVDGRRREYMLTGAPAVFLKENDPATPARLRAQEERWAARVAEFRAQND